MRGEIIFTVFEVEEFQCDIDSVRQKYRTQFF